MISQLIKFHNNRTTKLDIGTSDLETWQKVSEDAWNRLQLCARQVASVYWARRLTIQPIIDARRTERMFTICCLATIVNTRPQQPAQCTLTKSDNTEWYPVSRRIIVINNQIIPSGTCKSSYHCDTVGVTYSLLTSIPLLVLSKLFITKQYFVIHSSRVKIMVNSHYYQMPQSLYVIDMSTHHQLNVWKRRVRKQ